MTKNKQIQQDRKPINCIKNRLKQLSYKRQNNRQKNKDTKRLIHSPN